MENVSLNIHKEALTKDEFTKLSNSIFNICGINLPEVKKILIEGRIRKRMIQLRIDTYSDYINYLFSIKGMEEEIIPLIDVITTNKTDFFRENQHFDYLTNSVLPEIIQNYEGNWKNKIFQFWSAGCSTGEEPYTMAIVLSEFQNKNPGFQFEIYASDISTDVLTKASLGIFDLEKIDVIPEQLKKKYLLRSKDPDKKVFRIVPELRNKVHFSRLNFMDDYYDIPENLNIIFCRNVIIYFDRQTQEKVLTNLSRKLIKGGYLFIGHSETIMGMNIPLVRVASTIYQKI